MGSGELAPTKNPLRPQTKARTRRPHTHTKRRLWPTQPNQKHPGRGNRRLPQPAHTRTATTRGRAGPQAGRGGERRRWNGRPHKAANPPKRHCPKPPRSSEAGERGSERDGYAQTGRAGRTAPAENTTAPAPMNAGARRVPRTRSAQGTSHNPKGYGRPPAEAGRTTLPTRRARQKQAPATPTRPPTSKQPLIQPDRTTSQTHADILIAAGGEAPRTRHVAKRSKRRHTRRR